MPRKNIIKRFSPDSYYHVYNRAIDHNLLFRQEADYRVYKRYVKKTLKDMDGEIRMLSATLLPTHFHFLIWQREEDSMTRFMRSLSCKYSSYFRKKYGYRGTIFEGAYRARSILTDQSLDNVYRYIGKNALEAGYPEWPHQWNQGKTYL